MKTTINIVNKEKLRVRLPLCIHIVPQYNSDSGVTPIPLLTQNFGSTQHVFAARKTFTSAVRLIKKKRTKKTEKRKIFIKE